MEPANRMVMPVVAPGARMASWSFYLGVLGLLMEILAPALSGMSSILPILMYGGLAFGVIALVLGFVGLFSVNKASALAGLLFGALAVFAFLYVTTQLGVHA